MRGPIMLVASAGRGDHARLAASVVTAIFGFVRAAAGTASGVQRLDKSAKLHFRLVKIGQFLG